MKNTNHNSTGANRKFPIAVRCLAQLFAAAALATTTHAVGLRLPNQDPEAIARGDAFVATADNPSAIYYNPAGITQLEGDQFRAGMYLISASTEYTSPTGAKAQTDTYFQPVPQLYYTHAFKDTPLYLGLGVYAPYGLSLDWGSNPALPFGPIAQKGKVLYATFNPVIAWKVTKTLSLAIGPTINYSEAKLQNAAFNFKGDDVSPGFTAGILWQPHDKWSFGVKYHSATDFKYDGQSNLQFPLPFGWSPTTAEAHFPQFVVGGISFRPTPKWNFEFDLDWTDWDSLHQVVFQRGDTIAVPFPFNYQSGFIYDFGVTRQLGDGWFVSAGYIYSENSSPDANFNPLVPDDDLHLGSVGFGHHGQKIDWAIGYHFAYNGSRTVTGGTGSSVLANGTYRTFNNAVNVSVTYKF